jgi:hypothetical protein
MVSAMQAADLIIGGREAQAPPLSSLADLGRAEVASHDI